jgi:predicted HTH domain antitoxin
MRIICRRCRYVWDYRGRKRPDTRFPVYVCCPREEGDFPGGKRRIASYSTVMSQTLEIQMSDDVFLTFQEGPETLGGELRLAAAVKWYELGRLSQEKAAQVAGLSRSAFIAQLSRYRVSPFQETAAEIAEAASSD